MITIVMPYYENGGMLERHFEEWIHYPLHVKQQMRAIIVDDGSPIDAAVAAVDHIPTSNLQPRTSNNSIGFPIECYRIKQNIPWNVAGARNLGMHVTQEGWCLLTDIDHLLTRDNAELLVYQLQFLKPTEFATLGRRWADGRKLHSHPNSFVLQRWLFWQTGGCDEDWSGWWGAGEQVFRKTLHSIGHWVDLINVHLTHYGRDDIADASTREWGRKGSPYDWRNNPKLVEKARQAPYKAQNPLRFDWERLI